MMSRQKAGHYRTIVPGHADRYAKAGASLHQVSKSDLLTISVLASVAREAALWAGQQGVLKSAKGEAAVDAGTDPNQQQQHWANYSSKVKVGSNAVAIGLLKSLSLSGAVTHAWGHQGILDFKILGPAKSGHLAFQ